jgi:hypothetical protein
MCSPASSSSRNLRSRGQATEQLTQDSRVWNRDLHQGAASMPIRSHRFTGLRRLDSRIRPYIFPSKRGFRPENGEA